MASVAVVLQALQVAWHDPRICRCAANCPPVKAWVVSFNEQDRVAYFALFEIVGLLTMHGYHLLTG